MNKHLVVLDKIDGTVQGKLQRPWIYFANHDASETHFLPLKVWKELGEPKSLSFSIIATDLGET